MYIQKLINSTHPIAYFDKLTGEGINMEVPKPQWINFVKKIIERITENNELNSCNQENQWIYQFYMYATKLDIKNLFKL